MQTDTIASLKGQLRLYKLAALGAFAAFVFMRPGIAAGASESCDQFAQGLPSRSPVAPAASDLVPRLRAMDAEERDAAIAAELMAGNIPEFLRHLAPVRMTGELERGRKVRVTFCALPDYLAIGSDEDFMLVPMRLQTALVVAGSFGLLLPTTKMVDAIYQQSAVKLNPQPLPAGPQMRSTEYFWRHNQMVAAQRSSLGLPLGSLTAGDKKDLVLSNRLWQTPQQIAIYGWHRDVDRPIQPLSTVHGARYVDYSHGVRLVSPVVFVDGEAMSVFDLLTDDKLASLLSDDGPLPRLGELLALLKAALAVTSHGASDVLSGVALRGRYAP